MPKIDLVIIQGLRNDRQGSMRKGGGLLLLIKDDLKAIGHIPPTTDKFQEQSTERIWTLIMGEVVKAAVCFVYMASTSVPGYVGVNQKIYEMVQNDMKGLREEGYAIYLMGDFNGHLGPRTNYNPNGIIGDTSKQNRNGTLLLDFVEKEELVIGYLHRDLH